jgi:hypothetical protein
MKRNERELPLLDPTLLDTISEGVYTEMSNSSTFKDLLRQIPVRR